MQGGLAASAGGDGNRPSRHSQGDIGLHHKKGRPVLTTLFIALTLLSTIAAALGLGVVLGYFIISAILHTMARRPRTVPEPALVTSQSSSGD